MVDAPNLVFAGCSLLRGSGTAVVYATGRRTEFGKIAALSVEVRRPPTPLEREVSRMVRILTIVAVVMGARVLRLRPRHRAAALGQRGVHGGHHRRERARGSAAHADAGAGHGRPPPREEEGAGEEPERGRGAGLGRGDLHGQDRNPDQEPAGRDRRGRRVRAARRSTVEPGARCSRSPWPRPRSTSRPARSPAIRSTSRPARPCERWAAIRSALSRDVVRHIAFDVQRRRAAGVLARGESRRFAIKGAWEVVRPLRARLHRRARRAATRRCAGSRRRGCASSPSRRVGSEPEEVARRKPRSSEASSCTAFSASPIRCATRCPMRSRAATRRASGVILVTGDHPVTARAIAEHAGILPPDAPVRRGADGRCARVDARSGDRASACSAGVSVFARTTPEQKLKIVERAQANGSASSR